MEQAKIIGDGIAACGTFCAWLGMLPAFTAVLTFIYVAIRLWETKTVRRVLRAFCGRCASWWDA